jgi:hypothetical protein
MLMKTLGTGCGVWGRNTRRTREATGAIVLLLATLYLSGLG